MGIFEKIDDVEVSPPCDNGDGDGVFPTVELLCVSRWCVGAHQVYVLHATLLSLREVASELSFMSFAIISEACVPARLESASTHVLKIAEGLEDEDVGSRQTDVER